MEEENFELEPRFYEHSLDKHLGFMRDGEKNLQKVADFIEWFVEETETTQGVITNLGEMLKKFKEQEHVSEQKAAGIALILMAGSEWERDDPSPENREDTPSKEELEAVKDGETE